MSLLDIIPSAYAQTAATPAAGVDTMQMLQQFAPLILIVGVFYFVFLRPQQARAKEHKRVLSELKRGDNVITSGGIIGTVARVISDDEVSLEIAEGVRVRIVRSTITAVTGKGTPRPDAADDAEAKAKPARRGKTPPATKIAANESKPADA
jgi:preprotein translocase subunit YajC